MRVYQPRQPGSFDPLKISPSRVNALRSCGVAFERNYIRCEPEQKSGSAALFGSVLHEALEHWCVNRTASLPSLVRAAWLTVTEGTSVRDFLGAYQALSVDAMKEEAAIREAWAAKGRESKAPRMTKQFKESAVGRKIDALMEVWVRRLNDESPWRFKQQKNADGTMKAELPALYDESLVVARRYQERWKHLPPALYAEYAFDVKWEGFILNGYIDAIEPVLDAEGNLVALAVLDYKTYAKEPAEFKDWLQTAIYDVALNILVGGGVVELPDVPIWVGVDYVRLTPRPGEDFDSRRLWKMTAGDHRRLLRELSVYKATVEQELFQPAEKGRNVDFCPYPESCCLTTADAISVDTDVFDVARAA